MRYTYAIAAAAFAAIAASGCTDGDKPAESAVHNVFIATPEPAGMPTESTFPAKVEEARTISAGFKTAGQIERIFVKEGQHVSAGQPLAMLDTVDYALGISTLREKYRQLSIETERRAKLHAGGNMSDNDYENAVSGLRQLKLQLQLEENKLAYCLLKAPTAGIVTKISFEKSEMVDAGTPVIELMDNSRLEAVVDLPVRAYAARGAFESFYGTSPVAPGKRMRLEFLSLTPKADNSQLYTLRLGLPARAEGITPGMNMTVTIVGSGSESASVSVPLSAVFDREGRTCVWTVNPADSVITATPVTTAGTADGGRVEITSGLPASSIVVRAGVHHLHDGEKVNIIPDNSAANPGNVL